MTQTVSEALKRAAFYSDGQLYTFVRLPLAAIMAAAGVIAEVGEPFCALIVDKDEVTLLLPSEAWEDFAQRLPGHAANARSYSLITIDLVLDPDLVGFMARISEALANAGITIMPFAAFTRDHIFVLAEQFDLAIATLETLKSNS